MADELVPAQMGAQPPAAGSVLAWQIDCDPLLAAEEGRLLTDLGAVGPARTAPATLGHLTPTDRLDQFQGSSKGLQNS
jgi:hypothetical protein